MTKSDLNGYARRVTQATRTELIVIMYEVAIKYIEDGIVSLKENNMEEFRYNIKKAKEFINELSSVLDMKYDISKELFRLYSYMNRVLVKADTSPEENELLRIIGMINKLKDSFERIGENDKKPLMQNAQQVYAGITYSKNSLNEYYGGVSDIKRGYKA